jgi:hypothetical protein
MSSGELPRKGVSRITGLVLINALIFQEVLSTHHRKVKNINTVLRDASASKEPFALTFSSHWAFIVKEIDYYPIFHLASELLLHLPAVAGVNQSLTTLAKQAATMVGRKAALRHDLMGRIFHRLLLEAKYLATYYTSIPAATMLLRTALRPTAWTMDWSNLEEIADFRIADLACGTGTLLMAAADAVSDNALRAFHTDTSSLSDFNKGVHQVLAEKVIYGYDVLPTALHLTAATLAMRAPDIAFENMNLSFMPLGGRFSRLGSLDFLISSQMSFDDIFGASAEAISSKGKRVSPNTSLPMLNLCTINPPFTRSVGGNLLFGSIPEKRRAAMQKRLKNVVREQRVKANITAGLGAVFIALANRHILPGGRIALVLPKALLNGVAWEPTREIFRSKYVVEHVFSSHDPERWNFSDSTSLSEVMLIARKLESQTPDANARTVHVNFYRNPTNIIEALNIAHQLDGANPGRLETPQGAQRIMIGGAACAEVVSMPWSYLKRDGSFMWGTAFAQSDITRVLLNLVAGKVLLPGSKIVVSIPVTRLDQIGTLGPDRRDIHDAFALSKSGTAYPCVWGRDAGTTRRLNQSANSYLVPLSTAKKGRNLRKVADLWPLASDVLLAERLRLNTQSVLAVKVDQEVLTNMWWTFRLNRPNELASKALVLWLNSTLGLTAAFGTRLETEGAWIAWKKPMLARLPVIDVMALGTRTLKKLGASF